MDIDQAVVPALYKIGRQNAHEAGLAHQLGLVFLEPVGEGALKGFPIGKVAMGRTSAGTPARLARWSAGTSATLEMTRDLGRIARLLGSVQKRLEIAAAARNRTATLSRVTRGVQAVRRGWKKPRPRQSHRPFRLWPEGGRSRRPLRLDRPPAPYRAGVEGAVAASDFACLCSG